MWRRSGQDQDGGSEQAVKRDQIGRRIREIAVVFYLHPFQPPSIDLLLERETQQPSFTLTDIDSVGVYILLSLSDLYNNPITTYTKPHKTTLLSRPGQREPRTLSIGVIPVDTTSTAHRREWVAQKS